MSQKSGKRNRRRTDDDPTDSDFKAPSAVKNLKSEDGGGVKTRKSTASNGDSEENGLRGFSATEINSSKMDVIAEEVTESQSESPKKTRSRSNTPQSKKGTDDKSTESELEPKESTENGTQDMVVEETDIACLEPFVLEIEDSHPELVFDENSDVDLESEGSPLRCKTRRSQSRSAPTPGTPKCVLDSKNEEKSKEDKSMELLIALERLPEIVQVSSDSTSNQATPVEDPEDKIDAKESDVDSPIDLNATSESFVSVTTENLSTRAVAGGDATRNIDTEFSFLESNSLDEQTCSFLNASKERSLGETMRSITSRRSIRSINTEYYKKCALNNKLDKDFGLPYPARQSVEFVLSGKRKRSLTPDQQKRFKSDHSGFLSYITNPLSNIKNRFGKSEAASSTPKLTSYKSKGLLEEANVGEVEVNGADSNTNKWCIIM